MQAYGIDLHRERIDWREFCALLSCVPESTALINVIKMRASGAAENMDGGLEKLFHQLEEM
jgi:hypothetical protein